MRFKQCLIAEQSSPVARTPGVMIPLPNRFVLLHDGSVNSSTIIAMVDNTIDLASASLEIHL